MTAGVIEVETGQGMEGPELGSGAGGEVGEDRARLDGMQVSIIGLGASGFAAALLAVNRGAEVYVSEIRTDAETRARRDRLVADGVAVEIGGHDIERMARSDLVVASPGIPPDAAVLVGLRERGADWVSEPEFAVRFLPGALISITGTNGKSTVSALTAHLLEAAGTDVALGGNIGAEFGPPATGIALRDHPPAWTVLEMSSFQLGEIRSFRPDIGVVTNLAPDHLDRYATVEEYYADKARLFQNADDASRWVLNGDDAEVLGLPGDAPGSRYLFSLESEPETGAFVRDGVLLVRLDGVEEAILSVDELPLLGRPGVANALAAALTARLAGARPDAIARGLRGFRPLRDRLEPLGSEGGVLWVNDSKATNVAAAVTAIGAVGRPVVLLLGGKDKGEELAPLAAALDERVRAVVLYGAARERFGAALTGASVPVDTVDGGFEEAVAHARSLARPGDALLLAPACSSFDMFGDYRERGARFRELAAAAGATAGAASGSGAGAAEDGDERAGEDGR